MIPSSIWLRIKCLLGAWARAEWAAITGNILGAYLGIDAIPDFYKEGVELRDTILDMSDKLLAD